MDSLTLPILNSELKCRIIAEAIDTYSSSFYYDYEVQQGLACFDTKEELDLFCDLINSYKDIVNYFNNLYYSN